MINKDQVRDLLGQGISTGVVATTVGCDHAYISQLMSNEAFAQEVAALRAANLTAVNARDKSIDAIEDKLILKLDEAVDSGMIYKPRDILQAFASINNAKRRGIPHHEAAVVNNKIVNLAIPSVSINNYVTNVHNEIIEVDSKTLVTMDSKTLIDKMKQRKGGENAEQLKRVESYLPSSS